MSISLTIAVGDVTEPPAGLDDHVRSAQLEVDAGDAPAVASMDHLASGTRESSATNELQELPLEIRLTTAVEQQGPQERASWNATPALSTKR